MTVQQQDVKKLAGELERKSAQDVIQWGIGEYKNKIALASSFGAEDVVLVDMIAKIDKSARIFTLDTGRLPQETYEVIEKIRKKYGINIEFFFPDTKAVEEMENTKGPDLFYDSVENRKLCCNVRKMGPLRRTMSSVDAWICGLRREQAVTRTDIMKVEIDETNGGKIKLNPLADWTEKQVWEYIKKNNVPYNALHDKNYPSIGCAPCTRAIEPGEDVRAGRWWWESPETKECGLHAKKK
ncbi:MAG: phosphoadenosine phosphosulfate reductase [Candidatus Omnitrophica bacterium CG1_02_49_10]|nr:MAG: phosphoadenosine phosphosulfate reductase [Candidatus Omnitrophica bacterium CG1_02_49_10]